MEEHGFYIVYIVYIFERSKYLFSILHYKIVLVRRDYQTVRNGYSEIDQACVARFILLKS